MNQIYCIWKDLDQYNPLKFSNIPYIWLGSKDGAVLILQTEEEIDLNGLLQIDDILYHIEWVVFSKDGASKDIFVHQLSYEDIEKYKGNSADRMGEETIVCPVCGYKIENEFNMPNKMNDCVCARCNSVFSYQRNVKITYDSHIVTKKGPQILKGDH